MTDLEERLLGNAQSEKKKLKVIKKKVYRKREAT